MRKAFPELHLRIEPTARAPLPNASSITPMTGAMTPPEYVHTPTASHKRRRLSTHDDAEGERARQVPRLYASPVRNAPRQAPGRLSPPPPMPPGAGTESWVGPPRASPYPPPSTGLPHIPLPATMEQAERVENRPPLPSLTTTPYERPSEPIARPRGHYTDDYVPEGGRPIIMHPHGAAGMEPTTPAYRQGGYPYGYHHPGRAQSLSVGSIHAFDRTPFAAAGYGPQYPQDYMRVGELGVVGVNGDGKQRKRRGNLPKETTDKLRAWFVAHLHHPYPTEDEKQELVRQTGLQMSECLSPFFRPAQYRLLERIMLTQYPQTKSRTGSSMPGVGSCLP